MNEKDMERLKKSGFEEEEEKDVIKKGGLRSGTNTSQTKSNLGKRTLRKD
jgi:hypothetical protein